MSNFFHEIMNTDKVPTTGISKVDPLSSRKNRASADTHPHRNPLHPESLTLKDMVPGTSVQIHNRVDSTCARASVVTFPYRTQNGHIEIMLMTNATRAVYWKLPLSVIGVTPYDDSNLWDASYYVLKDTEK